MTYVPRFVACVLAAVTALGCLYGVSVPVVVVGTVVGAWLHFALRMITESNWDNDRKWQ